jgi:hypothetical protein
MKNKEPSLEFSAEIKEVFEKWADDLINSRKEVIYPLAHSDPTENKDKRMDEFINKALSIINSNSISSFICGTIIITLFWSFLASLELSNEYYYQKCRTKKHINKNLFQLCSINHP